MPTEPDVREVPADVLALARLTAGDIFFPDIVEEEDVRRIADAIISDRATRKTAKAARREALEEAARFAADGMKCLHCGAFFWPENGHDESDGCANPSWDGIPQNEMPTAIRALAAAIRAKAEG